MRMPKPSRRIRKSSLFFLSFSKHRFLSFASLAESGSGLSAFARRVTSPSLLSRHLQATVSSHLRDLERSQTAFTAKETPIGNSCQRRALRRPGTQASSLLTNSTDFQLPSRWPENMATCSEYLPSGLVPAQANPDDHPRIQSITDEETKTRPPPQTLETPNGQDNVAPSPVVAREQSAAKGSWDQRPDTASGKKARHCKKSGGNRKAAYSASGRANQINEHWQ